MEHHFVQRILSPNLGAVVLNCAPACVLTQPELLPSMWKMVTIRRRNPKCGHHQYFLVYKSVMLYVELITRFIEFRKLLP